MRNSSGKLLSRESKDMPMKKMIECFPDNIRKGSPFLARFAKRKIIELGVMGSAKPVTNLTVGYVTH